MKLNLLLLFSMILCFTFNISGQRNSIISGVVTDAETGNPLPSANILIEGTSSGTTTDIYGNYMLPVTSEKLVLVFTYIGYLDERIEVDMSDKNNEKVNVSLVLDAIGLGEVIVTMQMLGQTKAINQQLNSDAIVNVVSEEKMKELPDANAAEAISRISGISLIRNQGEGQKVVVRGLEPRFSSITINGIKIPSNDVNDKSVDLSMISPEILQGIEVFKSPTPDMDADAIGGSVNLVLNKAKAKPALSLRASNSYNYLRNDFNNYNLTGTFSRRFFNSKLGMVIQANAEKLNRSSDDLEYGEEVTYLNDSADRFDIIQATLRKTEQIRERFGGSVNLDYALKKGSVSFNSVFTQTDLNTQQRKNSYAGEDNTNNFLILDSWKGKTNLFSNMLSGTHNVSVLKIDWVLSSALTKNIRPEDYQYKFINSNPFGGADIVNTSPSVWIERSLLVSDLTHLERVDSETRDIKESNTTAALNFEIPFEINNALKLTFKLGGKANLLQRTRDDYGSWEPLYKNGVIGTKVVWDPEYANIVDVFFDDGRITLPTFSQLNYQQEDFIEGYTFNNPLDYSKVNQWHDYFSDDYRRDVKITANNLDLTENIYAGYFMAKLNYVRKLTLITGFRLEQSENQYKSKIAYLGDIWDPGIMNDTITSRKYTEFLPHFHLKFKPLNWFDIRFSYTQTLARPNYNWIAFSTLINNISSTITTGNPNLKHMKSTNYDMNLSFHSGRYGLVTIGGFYKDIKDVFYRNENFKLVDDSIAKVSGWPNRAGYILTTYENSPKATVYGYELDLQTNLKFLPKPFNGIVISFNFTGLYSETTKYTNSITDSTYRDPITRLPVTVFKNNDSQRKIRIPGQVPLIYNIAVGYDLKGFSARISGNYQGRYLIQPGGNINGITDEYRLAFWRWDLALKQRINESLEVFFNVNNLNNMVEETTFNNDLNRKYYVLTGPIFNYGIRFKI